MAFDSTDNRAAAKPYVTDFKATVQSIDGNNVQLDKTYFYAEGGGQPADCGTLNEIEVVDVQNQGDKTHHMLATEPDFKEGDVVTGVIDTQFRTYCMRAHTASHLLYGAGRKLFSNHGYGGFNIGPEKARLDFETNHDPNDVNKLTLERMVNEAVWDSRDVTWRKIEAAHARERGEVVFNFTDRVDKNETVRIVEINDWDIAACGGTHVQNTCEIGPVKVFEVSNPGADLVRVEYAVGPAAIQAQLNETRATTRAARTLDTSIVDLPERATSIVEANASLKSKVENLRDQLLDERLELLVDESIAKNGNKWVIGEIDIEGTDSNDLSDRVRDLAGEIGDVIALTGHNGNTFVVVGTTGETDASEIVDDVTAKFGGGGGGGETFAQGGGLDEDPSTIVDFLRKEL